MAICTRLFIITSRVPAGDAEELARPQLGSREGRVSLARRLGAEHPGVPLVHGDDLPVEPAGLRPEVLQQRALVRLPARPLRGGAGVLGLDEGVVEVDSGASLRGFDDS